MISEVGDISYVGDKKSYVGLTIMSYVGFTKAYVDVIRSYVGVIKSYVGDTKSYHVKVIWSHSVHFSSENLGLVGVC